MVTKKPQKTPKSFFCEKCDFVSLNKKDYARHRATDKHQMVTNGNQKTPKTPEHNCPFCENKYKFNSGLSRHIKKCKYNNYMMLEKQTQLLEHSSMILQKLAEHKSEKTVQNIITNNITIQMFLDTSCKDAITFEHFIKHLKVNLHDLVKTQEVGYVTGISNVIIKNLDELDITQRPIHCEKEGSTKSHFYIKTDNDWESDSGNTVTKAIEVSKKKHFELLSEWMANNPGWDTNDNKTVECMNLIKQINGQDSVSGSDNKIIENIGNAVKLNLK